MVQQSVRVADIIDRNGIGRLQWTAIVLCGLVALLDGFDNQSIAFVAPLVASELKVAMSDFGPIFGAGLFGLMVGTLMMGPVADRVGRKPIILLSVALFGILTLLTPLAETVRGLVILRFLAGVGLGGALPNIIALTSEYAPRTRRATLVSLMFCGIPLGAVIGGLASTQLMVHFGWRSVFYAGGTLPLLLLPVLFWLLPESLQFLIARDKPARRTLDLLRRLDPVTRYADDTVFTLPDRQTLGSPVSRLFTDGRGPVTLLLWLTFFSNLLVMFYLISWLPSVLRQSGMAVERAALATVILNAGGVTGGLLLGRLVDRRVSFGFITFAYTAGALVTALLGFTAHVSIPLFLLNIFAAGFLMLGLQFCMNAIAAGFYPTELRSTGVGWALGIGRTGSVVGPILGGILIGMGWSTEQMFVVAAAPALLAAISVFLISARLRRAAELPAETSPKVLGSAAVPSGTAVIANLEGIH